MENQVHEIYGNRIRVRVCGLLVESGRLLMINHKLNPLGFWAPPGGGMEFGESAEACLQREFREETRLQIEVLRFRFACEFIKYPLHAVELFFDVRSTAGSVSTGLDPEMNEDQIILEARFMTWREIQSLDPVARHGIFNRVDHAADVTKLEGYFRV